MVALCLKYFNYEEIFLSWKIVAKSIGIVVAAGVANTRALTVEDLFAEKTLPLAG
jgi:hypothetical protein